MTIYVYKLRGMQPFSPRATYQPPWFGLTADTEQELHPFAEQIGLDRDLYRPPTVNAPRHVPGVGHYDLDERERNRAVALGAQPITARQLDRQQRKLAAEIGVMEP